MRAITITLLISLPFYSLAAADSRAPEITILSTMVANYSGVGEWGFSALIETGDEKILFDTGFKQGTVITNAEALGIDLSGVERVILTHFHTDHTGGLLSLRRKFSATNPQAFTQVYVARGFFKQRYSQAGEPIYSLPGNLNPDYFSTARAFRAAAQKIGIQFTVLDEPLEIAPNLHLTGPISRPHKEHNVSPGFFLSKGADKEADTMPESQVLGVMTPQGWILISGCGHAGIINAATALRAISPQNVFMGVGGFHLFRASKDTLDWTSDMLGKYGLKKLVGAHCTGIGATFHIADRLNLPHSDISVGAIGTRIDPNFKIQRSSIE